MALWCFCSADVVEFSNGKAGIFGELLFAAVQYTTSTIVSIFYYKFFNPNKSLEREGRKYSLSLSTENQESQFLGPLKICVTLICVRSKTLKTTLLRHF